jgi:hypothetical protein
VLPRGPPLTCHGRRDTVAEQIEAGEPLGEVEDSIDQVEQQLDPRAHLASLL